MGFGLVLSGVHGQFILRYGVINHGANAVLFQVLLELVAFAVLHANGVLVKHVAFGQFRRDNAGNAFQEFVVLRGHLPAPLVPAVNVRQFDAQNGGLKGIQAAVVADHFVVVLLAAAVRAKGAGQVGGVVVVGDQQAAITKCPQVLAGEKGVGPSVPYGARMLTLVPRAEGLGAVFDNLEAVLVGNRHDLVHLGRVAVQMNGHEGLGVRGKSRTNGGGVDVEGVWVNIREHWGCAHTADAFGGGKKAEGRGDYFVAGADIQGTQGNNQRVGATVQADGVFDAQVRGGFILEGFYVRPHDEVPAPHHAVNGIGQVIPQFIDFGGQVKDRNGCERWWGGQVSLLMSVSLSFW